MKFRVESDTFGTIEVPDNNYYGAQTARSLRNFKIGTEKFSSEFICAYAVVKYACAAANEKLGTLDKNLSKAIKDAAAEIIDGKHPNDFPLAVWQTGSGTQTNMNLNEVISNRAIEILGGEKGSKKPVHPNDHVNCSQSTNDSFPTAMHVAAAQQTHYKLIPAIKRLADTFSKKAHENSSLIKMGRTHLQDATPITLGQEFSAFIAQLQECEKIITQALAHVYELAIGGTAVGTGLNAPKNFSETVCIEIAKLTKLPFIPASNKFAALAGHEPLVALSGALNTLACAFMKIANDIRWLASGPRGGLNEIEIAANEPGSSIMPGKVNPTQSEAATMVCCQVMGNNVAISMGASQGNFQLNVFKPMIIHNILQSINLLADSLNSFDEHCAQSITPNLKRLDELKNKSLMLVTALAPFIGYDKAAMVAKKAHQEDKTLKQVVLELNLMTETEFDQRVKPESMLGPT